MLYVVESGVVLLSLDNSLDSNRANMVINNVECKAAGFGPLPIFSVWLLLGFSLLLLQMSKLLRAIYLVVAERWQQIAEVVLNTFIAPSSHNMYVNKKPQRSQIANCCGTWESFSLCLVLVPVFKVQQIYIISFPLYKGIHVFRFEMNAFILWKFGLVFI